MVRKYGRLLLYLCGVPVCAFVILALAQRHLHNSWMDAVRADFPKAAAAELESRNLPAMCQSPETRRAMGDLCVANTRMSALQTIAIVTIIVSLVLLVAIQYIAHRCRRDRVLLLGVFRAGSYAVTTATLLLVLSQAVLFAGALYYGGTELARRLPSGIILMTIIGAGVAVYKTLKVILEFNKENVLDVGGRPVFPAQAPELWRLVTETARAVGTEPPNNIVAGLAPTFFVTEAKSAAEDTVVTGRTLFISVPLCRILTPVELQSIIGHEMAHFHGLDTDFSRKFYPAYRHGANTLDAVIDAASSSGWAGYSMLPAMSLVGHYLGSFSQIEAEISRDRELVADQTGARVTSSRDFAVALTKIVQHDGAWSGAYDELLNSKSTTKSEWTLPSHAFVRIAEEQFRAADRAAQIRELESEQLAHPTDSHPPLGARLSALGLSVSAVIEAAGEIRPAVSASSLFPDADTLERDLIPNFTVVADRVQAVFRHRHPGFAAVEPLGLILNRSFIIYVASDGLYGLKFCDRAPSDAPTYFLEAESWLDNPWFSPGVDEFKKAHSSSDDNFFIPRDAITGAGFDGSEKWGLGDIHQAGKLRVDLREGKPREFILLGAAYGDGICRYILETYGLAPADETASGQ